ncbi:hypothetical protein NJB18091_00840 [Mycobacterium marinum]|nr:hypothetical protein NJB1507_13650 [Mycobacterium marinum]GJP27333.1 hypothetical protein NJB18091_00840 [Mycobacterium marinum]
MTDRASRRPSSDPQFSYGPIGIDGVGETVSVMLEHAVLNVIPGHEAEFESAFGSAKSVISRMPGFQQLSLSRCVEHRGRYLLLVQWDTLEHHTEGFRKSAEYAQWRSMLHGFYDPFPAVEHYEQIDTA